MRILFLAITLTFNALAFPGLAQADWSLKQPSSVHFSTHKNTHITEIHHFKNFDASVTADGNAKIEIDLTSVDTRIDIRNERMKEHLFEVSRYSKASFEAKIPTSVLTETGSGKPTRFELSGEVMLHGESAPVSCLVIIGLNSDKTITVSSVTPMLIDANRFKLVAGINKLQEIAGLKSITHTVPVMFSLTFKADQN